MTEEPEKSKGSIGHKVALTMPFSKAGLFLASSLIYDTL